MNYRVLSVLVGLTLAACALQQPPVDSAVLPHYISGGMLTEDFALQLASYTLMDPVRCKNSPVDATRSLAAVDYFAGALQWNVRWPQISTLTKVLMLQARTEVRQTLGIRPETRSQEVVDRLFAAADALDRHDTAAARGALTSPNFTLGPEATLSRLSDLPYLSKANWAVQQADQEAFPGLIFRGAFLNGARAGLSEAGFHLRGNAESGRRPIPSRSGIIHAAWRDFQVRWTFT